MRSRLRLRLRSALTMADVGLGGVGGLQGYQQTGMDAMAQQRALQGLDGPEAQAAAAKFKAENVGLTLSVTPCWCYGSETIDMDRTMPHAIWGFNGSERPGAVYLAAALAGHAQLSIGRSTMNSRAL